MSKQPLEKYFTPEEIKEHLDTGFYSIIDCHYCGNETLDSNFYCPHCGWSNDWTIKRDAYSSVNGCTMNEYTPKEYIYPRKESTFKGFDKKLTIPEGVKCILEGSLFGLDFVTDITLPSALEYFTPLAIFDLSRERGHSPRTSVNLHIENSDNFVTVNGSLYTKDMKKLIYTPYQLSDDTLEIPEGVEELGEASCAFVKPRKWHLTVKLPSTLKRISKNAFSGAYIASIEIPESVELTSGALANCQIGNLTLHREVIPTDCSADCECSSYVQVCNTVKKIERHAFKLGKVTNIYISPKTEVDSEFIDLTTGTDADKNKLTIGGEIGSSAHRFAEANGIRFIEVLNDEEEIKRFLECNHNISSSKWTFDEETPF